MVWQFVRKNPTIIYSISLLVVVPAILSGYAWWVTNSFVDLLDAGLQQRAVLMHQTVEVFLNEAREDEEKVEDYMERLQWALGDAVVDYTVLKPVIENNSLRFDSMAGFAQELELGFVFTQTQYVLAWQEDRSFATMVMDPKTNTRLMMVTRPLHDKAGQKWGLGTIALSLADHDNLLSSVQIKSSFILIVSVLIVLLLIANHARLFYYGFELHRRDEVDRLKDEFISVTSHELRTPITGLRSFLSLLSEGEFGKLTDKGGEYVIGAQEQASRLGALVDDMLDVSRLQEGRMEFDYEVIEPRVIVEKVIEQLQFKASEKGIKVEMKNQTERKVKIDQNHFNRIMVNLIGNAIKYTEKGSVIVTIRDGENKNIMINVRDTGIGIPPDKVKKLFQKFSRVHSKKSAKMQGTGLGLWITKALIEEMGGNVYVASIYGEGSEFTAEFPPATKFESKE